MGGGPIFTWHRFSVKIEALSLHNPLQTLCTASSFTNRYHLRLLFPFTASIQSLRFLSWTSLSTPVPTLSHYLPPCTSLTADHTHPTSWLFHIHFPCYHFDQPTVIQSLQSPSIYSSLPISPLASFILGLLAPLFLPQTCSLQVASCQPCPGQLLTSCSLPCFLSTTHWLHVLGTNLSHSTSTWPLTRFIHSVLPAHSSAFSLILSICTFPLTFWSSQTPRYSLLPFALD